MNLGLASISDAGERRTLARFNLRAGLKVAGSGAHGSALDLLRRCLELLGAERLGRRPRRRRIGRT